MYHDLCIPYTSSQPDLIRTLSFLSELSYSVAAISIPLPPGSGTTKNQPLTLPPLPNPPTGIKPLLKRLTLPILSTSDLPNSRLQTLSQSYDIIALRPTSEKTLLLATSAPEVDLISLDLSARWPFHFRPKMFSAAAKRGVHFEICYGSAIDSSPTSAGTRKPTASHGDLSPAPDPATARRNIIANGTSLIRALRGGKNIIFSSEGSSILGLRAPMDVVNFGVLIGLSAEKGLEAVRDAPALVVRAAKARREGWRGVLLAVQIEGRGVKRKADEIENGEDKQNDGEIEANKKTGGDQLAKPLSKKQMKKKAKLEKQQKATVIEAS